MGKNIIKIEDANITGIYSNEQRKVMNHYKDQPNNGPTIYCFKNPNTEITRTAFVDKSHLYEYDDVTDFEWHFGYKNGYPGVYFTFHAISDFLKYGNGSGNLICLETNSATKGKNKTIGVYTGDGNTSYIIDEHQNVTWFDLSTIVLNQEYFIYICGLSSFLNGNPKGPWHFVSRRKFLESYGYLPDDWTMTINIRPTIRLQSNRQAYTNYKALAKYQKVTYLYIKEYRF